MAVKRKRKVVMKRKASVHRVSSKRKTGRAVMPRKRKRKAPVRRVSRVRRNPVGQFVIAAHTSGKKYFFRASTKSFVGSQLEATRYRSRDLATRTARGLLTRLPNKINSVGVEFAYNDPKRRG